MFKKIFQPVDMTQGTPWKGLVLFAIPMLIGNIAQQLYSTVDSIIVGHFVGDNALAAVGSALPLLNLMLVLFIGISAGATIMVSQYFGARDKESLAATIGTCVTMTGLVSLFLMVCAPPLMQPFLKLLNTPADIIDDCRLYLIISMLGIAGMAFYNILSGILRGMGDSTSALVYLLIATGINIVLDLFFVGVMRIGVPGVAIATAI
ncbi:MAG: polysaccharide biosynthesis C-terminal domain-containing protein, partial [Firmicutes bacterium]|nr:polysaccharide biosynthesis C-terminal domain-containing protein [Bacillota bacterium]